MKGGLAAAAIAIRAAMKLGIEPRRPVLLLSVVGEETGGLGTLAAIARGVRADAAVITEPTSLELCPVQAGALSFRLHVRGKSATARCAARESPPSKNSSRSSAHSRSSSAIGTAAITIPSIPRAGLSLH